jgi:CheY-like chemotaxis protein
VPRVLVVEDYPPLANVIGIGLRRRGHVVERVGSVTRALDTEGFFDVVVLDIDLPDGSGVELAERLLLEQRTGAVAFYTGNRDPAVRQRALRVGPLLDKTTPLDSLLDIVEEELASQVALVAGAEGTVPARASARSGTRRSVK